MFTYPIFLTSKCHYEIDHKLFLCWLRAGNYHRERHERVVCNALGDILA